MKLNGFSAAAVCLIFFLSCGCTPQNDKGAAVEGSGNRAEIEAAVSILPQAYFVKRIGGERVDVQVMIPPGASPGTYEPSTKLLRNLSGADLYVRIGHIPFEKVWMEKLKSANEEMMVVDASKGIEIENNDPHIWLSPVLAVKIAENIYQGLAALDPENKNFYQDNLERLVQDLRHLDTDIRNTLPGINDRDFMVLHPSWGYYAREYDLNQIPINVEGKIPSAKELRNLIEKAEEHEVKVIFVSPQYSARPAEIVAGEIDAKVIYADPLARSYTANLREVTNVLAENL